MQRETQGTMKTTILGLVLAAGLPLTVVARRRSCCYHHSYQEPILPKGEPCK